MVPMSMLLTQEVETALMYAVQRGQEELVRILLSHGADKYIMNRQNDNCIDLAVLLEKKRIENILNNRRGSYATSVEIEIEETKKCKYSIRIKEDFCANMNSCNIFLPGTRYAPILAQGSSNKENNPAKNQKESRR